MTRKEAIKILKDSMAGRMVLYKDSIQATQMAIAALEKSPHWISVEDDLPKEDVFVQVVCDGYVSIARRHENRWQLGFGTKTADYLIYTPYNDKITHWMSLPEAPTVAKNATVQEKGGER